MGQNSSVAARLKPEQRKQLFIEMQSSSQPITAIANREGVSRKFLYQQQQKGNQALELGFNQSKEESEILSMDTGDETVDISGYLGVNLHLP